MPVAPSTVAVARSRTLPTVAGTQSKAEPAWSSTPSASVQTTTSETSVPSGRVAVAVSATVDPSTIVPSGTEISTCGASVTDAPTAAAASTRPPDAETSARRESATDVSMSRSLTATAVRLGSTERMRAAIPATCGVAIDVPLIEEYPPPRTVERIPDPGAATSTPDSP